MFDYKKMRNLTSSLMYTVMFAALILTMPYNTQTDVRFVRAAYDTFTAGSLNLEDAYDILFYTNPDLAAGLEDGHPVHGIEIEIGGRNSTNFALVGKAARCENCRDVEGFLLIVDGTTGERIWQWTARLKDDDALNAVVQLPPEPEANQGDLLVVGFKIENGVAKRMIVRLDLDTLRVKWVATDFGDSPRSHGAWEMITLNEDKNSILLSGVMSRRTTDEMWFKSYGNVADGQPVVMEIPISALDSAPTAASATWTQVWPEYENLISAKSIRPVTNNKVAILLWGEEDNSATLQLFDEQRQSIWGPTLFGRIHGEGTDIAVSSDAIAISGHGCTTCNGELQGKLTKVRLDDGELQWSKAYEMCDHTIYPTCVFIFNECWGVQALADDGFVLACGTGIEGCEDMTGSLRSSCRRGDGVPVDPRPDAVPRPAAVWQSFAVRTDKDGETLWQRVDQFRGDDDPALGERGWEPLSSASEYVILSANGDLTFVQDDVAGVGVMKLDGSSDVAKPKINAACICTQEYLPVCGSDGVTYSNDCVANCSGVTYSGGPCGADQQTLVDMKLLSPPPQAPESSSPPPPAPAPSINQPSPTSTSGEEKEKEEENDIEAVKLPHCSSSICDGCLSLDGNLLCCCYESCAEVGNCCAGQTIIYDHNSQDVIESFGDNNIKNLDSQGRLLKNPGFEFGRRDWSGQCSTSMLKTFPSISIERREQFSRQFSRCKLSERNAPVEGSEYITIKSGKKCYQGVEDLKIESGKMYTLRAWARGVNQPWGGIDSYDDPVTTPSIATIQVAAIKPGTFVDDETILGSLTRDVSAPKMKGLARADRSCEICHQDDGANIIIDGEYRIHFGNGILYQSSDDDPIMDAWSYASPAIDDGMALGPVTTPQLKGLIATWYEDEPPLSSMLTYHNIIGTPPFYEGVDGLNDDGSPTTNSIILQNSGNNEDPWVIDANTFYDTDTGRLWMVWGGHEIYVSELDPATSKLCCDDECKSICASTEFEDTQAAHTRVLSWSEIGYKKTSLESGFEGDACSQSYMEGPALYKYGDSFFIFGTYGSMGEDYTIRVCRSNDGPRGPYVDKSGRDCSKYSNDLPPGSSMLLGPEGEQSVPGHPHLWREEDKIYIGYDFREGPATNDEKDEEGIDYMAIREIRWIEEDESDGFWPTIWSPLEVQVLSDNHLDQLGNLIEVRLLNEGGARSQVAFDNVQFVSDTVAGTSAVNSSANSMSYDRICRSSPSTKPQSVCQADMCGFCIMEQDAIDKSTYNVRCCCDAQCGVLGDCCDSHDEVCGLSIEDYEADYNIDYSDSMAP